MSKDTMLSILVGETYQATPIDRGAFRPMDPRRLKRLLNTFSGTHWDTAETLNRAFGAHIASTDFRRSARAPTTPDRKEGQG